MSDKSVRVRGSQQMGNFHFKEVLLANLNPLRNLYCMYNTDISIIIFDSEFCSSLVACYIFQLLLGIYLFQN